MLLTPENEFVSYVWMTRGDTVSTDSVFRAGIPNIGTLDVAFTNANGCVTIDAVEISENCNAEVLAPNAFRPGGVSGPYRIYANDVVDANDFEILFFNRWGELIRQFSGPNFGWDGTDQRGNDVPPGNYVYIIRFTSTAQGAGAPPTEVRGSVLVIR